MSDNVTEQLKALLDTDEGKAYLEEQKSGLVTKRDELLGKLSKANETLTSYKELGEPDELKNTLQSVREAQQKAIDSDAEAKEAYLNEQVNKYKTEYETLQSSMLNDKVSTTIKEAVLNAKGDVDILVPLLTQRVKGELVDGNVSVNVYEDGQVAHKDGERMTVNDLLADMKTKHPNLFEVSASGTGTRPGQTAQGTDTTLDIRSTNFDLTKAAKRVKKTGNYESITKKYGW